MFSRQTTLPPSQNSIRHNLSLNQYFMKAPREKEGLGFGKGGYWCMHPDYEEKLTVQAYVKRKKKGIPVFPSAGLISRSESLQLPLVMVLCVSLSTARAQCVML